MIAILQRVSQAHVEINTHTVSRIGAGLLVLLCVEHNDTEREATKMCDKILKMRIFPDEAGKMNRSVLNLDGHDGAGEMLVVSQFTLAADTASGNRPGFSGAAGPELGKRLCEFLVTQARLSLKHVGTGEFGADMKVHLVNDGPVTIPIRIAAQA